jgi:hypothetical protein
MDRNELIANIIGIVLLLWSLIFVIKGWYWAFYIKKCFESNNVIVFGKKGKGKDMLFHKMILMRGKKYGGNIDYGYDFIDTPINSISVSPNTYNEMLNGNVVKIKKKFLEKVDYYISDGGIFLPSQYDTTLDKLYPSLPITYATSRHLGLFNIHINVQYLGRIWKKLREQADTYFQARGVTLLPFGILLCKVRYYEKYESAERGINPLSARMLNSFSRAEVDKYDAENGLILDMYYFVNLKNVYYNTRHFATVFYDVEDYPEDVKRYVKRLKDHRTRFGGGAKR